MAAQKLTEKNWSSLLNKINTILLDCDGVLWRGNAVINKANDAISYLQKQGKTIVLLTNNSSKSRSTYVEKCKKLGFDINDKEQIITTSHLTSDFLVNKKFTGKVYIVGSNGIGHELDAVRIPHLGVGPDPVPENQIDGTKFVKLDPEVKAVVVGFDAHFSYNKLMKAVSYLKNPECLFIATNGDETIPDSDHPDLVCPGTGCFVAAVSVASGRKPITLGKPHKPVFDFVQRQFKIDPAKTLMVGDRLNTDIQLAKNFGMISLLVLTGVTKKEDLGKPEYASMLPDFYTDSLDDILKFQNVFSL